MEFRLATSGIRFNEYVFTEPISLAGWMPPKCAGLFSILITDPNWAPKAFQPLYFGELGNNSRVSAVLQECQPALAAAAGKTLFVAILPMPFSTTEQRRTVRNELIWAYNPICHADENKPRPGDLAFKLAELEKKHQEQTAQMMQLIACMNPPSDISAIPRRRIGFVTYSESPTK
jgi:hypothetical protein